MPNLFYGTQKNICCQFVVWTKTFFKISSFMFRRKKVIQVWNDSNLGVNYPFKRTSLQLPIEGALEAMTDVTPRGVGQLSLKPSRPFTVAQMEDLLLRLQLSGQPWSSCPIIQWGGNGTSPNASDITHSPLPKECLPRSINITDKQWPARTSSCAGLANASKDGWRWRRGEKNAYKSRLSASFPWKALCVSFSWRDKIYGSLHIGVCGRHVYISETLAKDIQQ